MASLSRRGMGGEAERGRPGPVRTGLPAASASRPARRLPVDAVHGDGTPCGVRATMSPPLPYPAVANRGGRRRTVSTSHRTTGTRSSARLAAVMLPMAVTLATAPAAWASPPAPEGAHVDATTAQDGAIAGHSLGTQAEQAHALPLLPGAAPAAHGAALAVAHLRLPWLSTPRVVTATKGGGPQGHGRKLAAPRPARPAHPASSAVRHHTDLARVGAIGNFGDAPFFGSPSGRDLAGLAMAPGGAGYWAATAGGNVFAYGKAHLYGQALGHSHADKVTAIAPTPDGHGYWLATATGAVLSYGDARFFGSLGAKRLSHGVVAMAPTHNGRGYWLVTSAGSVHTFGDARFFGPTRIGTFPSPVVGIAPTADGRGYWLATSTGDVYTYGDARFFGSLGKQKTDVRAIAAAPGGEGYYLLTAHGRVQAFGHAHALGSADLGASAAASSLAPTPDGRGYVVGTSAWPALPATRNGAMQRASEPARPPAAPHPQSYMGTFMVTCYDLTGTTASGQQAGPQSVAVDPSVIPLGSHIYVDGAGMRVADDTGGAIIGDHLDIWEPTYSQCAQWGVRYRAVYRVNG